MPAVLNIKDDISKAMAFYDRSGRRAVKKAAAQALNRVANSVFFVARQQVAKAAGGIITQKKVKQFMSVTIKARFPDRLHAQISAFSLRRRGINLIEFVKKAQKNPKYWRKRSDKSKTGKRSGYRAGITAKAWGVERTYKGTFIQYGKNSGKPLVFKGVPGNRNEVEFVFGPSVRMIFISKTVMPRLIAKAHERWPIEWERQLSFFVGFRKKRQAARGRRF